MAGQLGTDNQDKKRIGNSSAAARQELPDVDVLVTNASEKRYLWTARAFAVITAISLCCNIVLVLAVFQLIPLFRLEPFLLTFQNKEEQVYNIVPASGNMEDEKAITETFVRQYVLLRSSFDTDKAEMEARWAPGGPVQEMSSPAVYTEFLEQTAKRALDIIRERSLIRNVRILSVNELGRGLWQVEYETQDMYPTSTAPDINYWTVSMRIQYRRKTVRFGERLDNPIGFTVIKYSLTHNKVN